MVAEYDVDQRRLFGSSADSYTVMALLNFNLFNGLADLAQVRESRAQEAQARDLKRDLEDRVRHQVTEAILTLKTAHERLRVAQAAVAQAKAQHKPLLLDFSADWCTASTGSFSFLSIRFLTLCCAERTAGDMAVRGRMPIRSGLMPVAITVTLTESFLFSSWTAPKMMLAFSAAAFCRS